MNKKKIIIHKKNEILRGSDNLSTNAKKTLNTIYYLLQKNNLYHAERLKISFKDLRKINVLSNNNDYVERLKKALKELMSTIELNNLENPIDKKTYKWFSTRFLNEVAFIKENNEWFCIIEVNKTIKKLMQIQKNFTKLDLINYTNKLKTKYAMKLYEFLKSFEKFRYINLPQEYLLKILGLENTKTYKSYSSFKRLLDRQIKEIKEKTDLKDIILLTPLKEDKKEKIFRFLINKKSKRTLKNKKEIKNLLDNSFKKI